MRLDLDTPIWTFHAPETTGLARSAGEREGGRAPFRVARFVVALSLAFALAAALVLATVHRFATADAERSAARQASLIASGLLQREVGTSDLARPVPAGRRRELDAAVLRPLLASNDVLGVALVRRNGSITYSTGRGTFGASASREHAAEAASGALVSVKGPELARPDDTPRTLETYAPLRLGSAEGAALIVQPYAPIRHAARAAQARAGGALEALVLVLYFVLVPLLARMTRRRGRPAASATTVERATT